MEKEIFVDIINFDGIYQIGNQGTVISLVVKNQGVHNKLKETYLLPTSEIYRRVTLQDSYSKRRTFVHRLVAEHFVPNIYNKPQINHIDGNKYNNHYTNLEWCTASENMIHAYATGLNSAVGVNNGRAKLTNNDVIDIKQMLRDTNYTQTYISAIYNVTRQTISLIKSGKNWAHVVI